MDSSGLGWLDNSIFLYIYIYIYVCMYVYIYIYICICMNEPPGSSFFSRELHGAGLRVKGSPRRLSLGGVHVWGGLGFRV